MITFSQTEKDQLTLDRIEALQFEEERLQRLDKKNNYEENESELDETRLREFLIA
jgi:hypothetical protein